MANYLRDPGPERFWRGVLRRQARSGLGVRAFCRDAGLSEPSFYAWRRTIRQRDDERKEDGPAGGREPRRGGVRKAGSRNGRRKTTSLSVKRNVLKTRGSRKTPKPTGKSSGSTQPAFLPVVLDIENDTDRGSAIVVELCGGRRLLLPESTSPGRLAAIVHAVECEEAVS